MGDTKIEWADVVWNPVTGCTPVSEGCKNCYARELHTRRHKAFMAMKKMPNQYWFSFDVIRCHQNRLDIPSHWRKPRRVFVNSMSDLFHPDVPDDFIVKIWLRMLRTQRHTYMVLTKRPERMAEIVPGLFRNETAPSDQQIAPNIWLGVSVENQKTANERIPILLKTPAAVRFVSVEPMLENVKMNGYKGSYKTDYLTGWMTTAAEPIQGNKIDWVICGGETGKNARPMHPDWVRGLRDQCQNTGVPFFFKQWGEFKHLGLGESQNESTIYLSDLFQRIGKRAAGRLLDGREWNELPERP